MYFLILHFQVMNVYSIHTKFFILPQDLGSHLLQATPYMYIIYPDIINRTISHTFPPTLICYFKIDQAVAVASNWFLPMKQPKK